MEDSAHYWARELKATGHDVLLMPPSYIKPSVKRGKNDAVDAGAICEPMSRPGMRFVPIKIDAGHWPNSASRLGARRSLFQQWLKAPQVASTLMSSSSFSYV